MSSNVIFMIVAGIVVLVLLLWLLAASRRTKVQIEARSGDEAARRNQALIDAAPAASAVPRAMPDVPVPVASVVDSGAAGAVVPMHMAVPGGDDLTRLKGVGPKLADQLGALGVTRFAQIAAWDDAEIDRIDSQLGRFQGRIRRDDWPAQARFLEAGDTAGYEAKFGRL